MIALSDEQQEIRSVARRFLESVSSSDALRAAHSEPNGYDLAVWKEIAGLGWPAMCLPEEFGGLAFTEVDRVLLMEELGRTLTPCPFLSSAVLAADAIQVAGSEAARSELLPRIGDGATRMTLVARGDLHCGSNAAGAVSAMTDGDAWSLTGDGGTVVDGESAEVLVVAAAVADGLGLFMVEQHADGMKTSRPRVMDETRRFARVTLQATPTRRLDDGVDTESAVRMALARSTVALSAEMVGAAQHCLDLCVAYAKERQQFGVPIGSFQVIKHRLARLAVEVDASREAVFFAAEVIGGSDLATAELVASSAKSAATDTVQQAADDVIQVHGGIGYTDEHDAHLFFKRAQVDSALLGNAGAHRHRMARLLGV